MYYTRPLTLSYGYVLHTPTHPVVRLARPMYYTRPLILSPTHPVVQLHNDMVGCLVRSKLHVHHSVHSQLGQGRETTSAQMFTQLCVCVGGGEEGLQ